jgi:hypothetical protein
LAALTTILDACAFRIAASDDPQPDSAERTLAIGRHAVADLSYNFRLKVERTATDRLDDETFARLYQLVEDNGVPLADRESLRKRLDELRFTYERRAEALGGWVALALPSWLPGEASAPAEPISARRRL